MYTRKLNNIDEFNSYIDSLNKDCEVIGCDIPKDYPCIIVCNDIEGFDGIDKVDYLLVCKNDF